MAPRPEELERDIVLARDQLRRDVEALVARVSPGDLARRRTGQLRRRAGRGLRTARDEALDRPLALAGGGGLAALSLATLIWRVRAKR